MDNHQELQLRRQAIRLWLKGVSPKQILQRLQRSRVWLSKWRQRFDQQGHAGLQSRSRTPQVCPTAYSPRIVRLIIQIRRRLMKQKVGLIGAATIHRELKKLRLGKPTPSLSTIGRILRQHHLIARSDESKSAYFPKPLSSVAGRLHAMDWTCRYLEDGIKVYAFHTLDLRTRACTQWIAIDKSLDTVFQHCFQTWKTLGLPEFLQLDNDAVFCGGYKKPRLFGQFVRLSLYLGIELIFLPVAEPKCNGEVEELNGLWGHAFWERRRFRSVTHVERTSPAFVEWYMTDHVPPHLRNLTPAQAKRRVTPFRLTRGQIAAVPDSLPLTAGRIHFVRKVKTTGVISILNETWKVGKRWAGKYVWATVSTHRRRLEIWFQPSAQQERRLLRSYVYEIDEVVARLKVEFAHA